MLHQWMEKMWDTLLYVVFLIFLLFFFLFYWKNAYQFRYAEIVLQDFLDSTATTGQISLDAYEGVRKQIYRIDPDYTLQIICKQYELLPVCDLIARETLEEYYMGRNCRKECKFEAYEAEPEQEKEEELRLQMETKEQILAAENKDYLPLPSEEDVLKIEAARPYQKVYAGEKLITLCRVYSKEGVYYAEAEERVAEESGLFFLKLTLAGEEHKVPIEVDCYPRSILCKNGHKVVNSRRVLEEAEKTGVILCPYCSMLPDSITAEKTVLNKKTGEKLNSADLELVVRYKNGTTGIITPETEDWQDDYDENYCGMQKVTVRYRGKETCFVVLTENENCILCQNPCNDRSYQDYQKVPYCMQCLSEMTLFTGQFYEEERLMGMQELYSAWKDNGKMCLKRGDFVMVCLSKKGYETILQREVRIDGR